MARPKIINKFGTMVGWNNITINAFGRELEGIDEVNYTDEEDVAVAHGSGKMPIGKTKGNYKASAMISLYVEEVIALQKQLPSGVRIQDIPDFPVIVQYEFNGENYKDIIQNCSFSKNPRQAKNGEGKIVNKYDLVCTHIDWNV